MKTSSIFLTTALALYMSLTAFAAPTSAKGKPKGPPPLPPEVLAQYDTDGDGKLSDAEKAAMKAGLEEKRQALIAKYDANGDGVLNAAERAAMQADLEAQKLAELTAKFTALDTDASGGLSLEEFTTGAPTGATPERIQAAFKHLDKNKDNSVSLAEFTAKPKPPIKR